jgi:hypothetical protein
MPRQKEVERSFQARIARIMMFIQNTYLWLAVLFAVIGAGLYLGGWLTNADKYQWVGKKMVTPMVGLLLGVIFVLAIAGLVNLIAWLVRLFYRQWQKMCG